MVCHFLPSGSFGGNFEFVQGAGDNFFDNLGIAIRAETRTSSTGAHTACAQVLCNGARQVALCEHGETFARFERRNQLTAAPYSDLCWKRFHDTFINVCIEQGLNILNMLHVRRSVKM